MSVLSINSAPAPGRIGTCKRDHILCGWRRKARRRGLHGSVV